MADSPIELADPERRLALAYVPAARRQAVAALWALDEALARVVVTTREPALGRIRLAWWREALERLDAAPPPGEPVLQAAAAHLLPAGITGADMAELTAGWDALLPPDEADLAAHAAERGERLFTLTGRLLGGTPPAGAGATWGMADARRLLPDLPGERIADATADVRWPRPLRPLGMLHRLALRDPAERQGSPARIVAMLRHRLTGR